MRNFSEQVWGDLHERGQLQHGVAWHTRKAIRRSSTIRSVRACADELGISYIRLSAMLRGEIIMRIDDTAQLCELFDLQLRVPSVSAVSDEQPGSTPPQR